MKFTIFFLCILILACKTTSTGFKTNETKTVEPLFPGYVLFDMPNTGDVPGTIYRKNPQGQRFVVTKIALPISADTLQVKKYSGSRSSDFNLLLNFLGLKKADVSNNDTLNNLKTINYKIDVPGQPVREYVEDLQWGPAFEKMLPIIQNDIKTFHREKDTYYVIRETIKNTAYNVDFGETLDKNSRFRAAIEELANAKVGYSLDSKDSLHLAFTSTFPYRIFFVPEKLELTTGGNGKVSLNAVKVSEDEFYGR